MELGYIVMLPLLMFGSIFYNLFLFFLFFISTKLEVYRTHEGEILDIYFQYIFLKIGKVLG